MTFKLSRRNSHNAPFSTQKELCIAFSAKFCVKMCYYILDRDIYSSVSSNWRLNSRISIIGRCGRKNNLWNASLPYLTSVSLPPSKENHTVSYVKRVLGGGALIHTGYKSL